MSIYDIYVNGRIVTTVATTEEVEEFKKRHYLLRPCYIARETSIVRYYILRWLRL